MERSKQDFEALVSSQKEQLNRYEKRLKDVVTAYKGLLKEKEALETSLAAITVGKDAQTPETSAHAASASQSQNEVKEVIAEAGSEAHSASESCERAAGTDDHLQTQIITLMNSLATLSAEKSRMEASFQADKKQLRAQLAQKDKKNAELNMKMKESEDRAKAHVDEAKAKWIIERQEREKETNNQMVMIRELQKLYADERHLKENIEMQLNNFKTQFASNESESHRVRDLQAQLKDAKLQLKQLQANSKHSADCNSFDNAAVLKQVQQEMQQLKEQHAVAIKNEQKRVLNAEEQSRNQAALHEDRVANLEARLAELSNTVGSYDRLREQDQESIQLLKKKLQELERQTDVSAMHDRNRGMAGDQRTELRTSSMPMHDIAAIVDEIMQLKKLLISENARAANPVDVSKVFSVGADHVHCQEELNRMQQLLEAGLVEKSHVEETIQVQKTHICTLQEKVKVLNRNIDEQEIELKSQEEKQRVAVQEERAKWKIALSEMENDYRCKVNEVEQQLQKQRQRSLQLLDEKEQEIKTLQTSFEVFHNAVTLPGSTVAAVQANTMNNEHNNATASSDGESCDGTSYTTRNTHSTIKLKAKKLSVGDNCHMLHYANEIARKDIEIAGLRKAKYAAETSLRKAIHDKVSAQEELSDRIAFLEEHVDRLERCKTREGANLEYLKNVIISFIVTKDADGKRHMMKAISSVLQFTPTEIQAINAAFQKK